MRRIEEINWGQFNTYSRKGVEIAVRAAPIIKKTNLPAKLDKVILFGSVATNSATEESDVDIEVWFYAKFSQWLVTRCRNTIVRELIRADVPVVIGKYPKARRVEIGVGTQNIIEKYSDHPFERHLLEEGIIL